MKNFYYQTGEGAVISRTDFPTYTTRKRAAKKAAAQGYATLLEINQASLKQLNLTHYIK